MSEKHKKGLILVTPFYPFVGGLARYLEELYSRVVKEGVQCDLVCLDIDTTRVWQEVYKGINIYRVPVWFCVGRVFAVPNMFRWNQMMRDLEIENYDFISTHTRFFYTSWLGAKLARKYKKVLIHTEHGSGPVHYHSRIIKMIADYYDKTLGKQVLEKADHITSVSRAGAAFVKQLANRRAHVITNGIDEKFWQEKLAGKLPSEVIKWQDNRLPLIFVSRISREKGWMILMKAIKGLPEDVKSQLAIYIAGTGPDENKLKNTIEDSHLEDCVRYLGLCDRGIIRDLLAICASINLSSREGFQTTLLEAAAMNAYILTTPVGGTQEVMRGSSIGYMLKSASVDECEKAIYKLLARGYTRSIGREVALRYSWDKIAHQYVELIEQVC